jgi:hypothetical protein
VKVSFAHGLDGLGKVLLRDSAPSKGAESGKRLFQNYLKGIADKKAALRAKGRVFVDSDSASDGDGASSSGSDGNGGERGPAAGSRAAAGEADAFDDPFFQVPVVQEPLAVI